jgi:hypothetical protein
MEIEYKGFVAVVEKEGDIYHARCVLMNGDIITAWGYNLEDLRDVEFLSSVEAYLEFNLMR